VLPRATRIGTASSSCSACASRSAAIQRGSTLSSAPITTSVGPAIESIPTSPNTSRLAAATYAFPGPTILSTRGTVSVPYAIAATACAPPITNTRSTPAIRAAAIVSGDGPGVVMTISLTPATRAGTAVMTTVDG